MAKTLNADKFRAELAALAAGLRRTIEADCAAFPVDATASAERRRRVQHDFPFFRRTYFPHYTRGKDGQPTGDSAVHLWLDTTLPAVVDAPEGRKLAVAAPRGEAKTTFVDLFFALWCVVTGRKRYSLIIADAFEQAASFLEAIKVELESNPRLEADFKEHCGQGRIWNVGTIVTAANVKLQAFGAGICRLTVTILITSWGPPVLKALAALPFMWRKSRAVTRDLSSPRTTTAIASSIIATYT